MKSIKLFAGVSLATVMVAGAVAAPVLAGGNDYHKHIEVKNGRQTVTVEKHKSGKHVVVKTGHQHVTVKHGKCGKHIKVENGHQKVEVKKGHDCDDKVSIPTPVKETPVEKPVETKPAPVVTTPAPIAPVAAPVTPVAAPVEQPETLPETGAGAVAAASFAGLTGLGYAANMLRLRRRA